MFDLKYHDQTSAKVVFVTFGLVFMKSQKLKNFYQENKKLSSYREIFATIQLKRHQY